MENRSSVILEGLNSEQKAAVSCVDGPVLIVAGAGSGKTRVLTSRIAYILAEKNLDPARILALTFTKKAASEMKERIALMVGERRARRLYMGTFHSVFIRFLREFAESLGYPSTFTIYDTSDSVSAIKACLKELKLDDKVYKPKDVLSRISMAKNNLVTPAAYRRNAQVMQNDAAAKKPRIVDVYDLYAYKCKMAGVMDFDDILLNMNILLRDNPAALESVAGRFDYIMVDEYQDTNFSQYLILKKLSQFHKNICVVGDDSQSIYAFRGAKIENILNFKKDYPEHHIFRLEQNYRSTRVIVDAANSLIAKNSARIPKECYSMGEEGEKIRLIQAYDEKDEARQVVKSIKNRIYSDKAEYKDFAILHRTLNQSRIFEQILRENNIPFVVFSGPMFLERTEVKDVLAFLKLCANRNDNESFKRAISLVSGIGHTTVEALNDIAHKLNISLFETLQLGTLQEQGIKSAVLNRLETFRLNISPFCEKVHTEDCYQFTRDLIIKFELLSRYKTDNSVENQGRAANVEELLSWVNSVSEELRYEKIEEIYASGQVDEGVELKIEDFPPATIPDFLEKAALLSVADTDEGDNKVALMTIHASKGLEFPYVYVVGMEENIFPSGGFYVTEVELEEERRLFYVAMTRAKKNLELSFATTRFRNGKHESNSPSRFVREVDSQYIANPLTSAFDSDDDDDAGIGFGGWKKPFTSRSGYSYGQSSRPQVERRPSASQPVRRPEPVRRTEPMPVRRPQAVPKRVPDADFVPTPILQLKAGQRIEHNRFGFGKILEISGSVTDLKAKIAFDDHGEKILILKYAKIRAVDLENN
ncbi:MAG: UvrD-helicase domain-containing protein [Bacteroidales bacterium]|nr:UvrD-helicase domain-containing protein [Bacteroidales bacterium]MBQ9722530.1 UvrD-helicase domain-containing protein [Bacteroidales bacterium]